MFITIGTTIDGKYQIRGNIGSGGMGVVYEAYQEELERQVAIKLLTCAPKDDPEEFARFAREAKVLSLLAHPHIVQFYSYGFWHSYPYIAMERLQGRSLQHFIFAQGGAPLPAELTINLSMQICQALEHAHAAGVFHRDIKSSNVILSSDESEPDLQVKLIDFGLSKLLGEEVHQKLTQTGRAIGSVMYMSPEQCLGQPVDARSDIYSLGCLIYECLTGQQPYTADNAVAVMFQHLNEPVANTAGWNKLTPNQQRVVAKCMAKQVERRYSSADELELDLQDLLAGVAPRSGPLFSSNSDAASFDAAQYSVQGGTGTSGKQGRTFIRKAAPWLGGICIGALMIGALHLGQPAKSDGTADSVGESSGNAQRSHADLLAESRAALQQAETLVIKQQTDQALKMFKRANDTLPAPHSKSDIELAYAVKQRTAYYQTFFGHYDQSALLLADAVELSKHISKAEHSRALIRASLNMLHSRVGDSGLKFALQAAALAEECLKECPPGAQRIARRDCLFAYNQVGAVYAELKQPKEAEKALRKSVMHAEQQDVVYEKLNSLSLLAENLYSQHQYADANAVMKRWVKLAKAQPPEQLIYDGQYMASQLSGGRSLLARLKREMVSPQAAKKDFDEALRQAFDNQSVSRLDDIAWRYYDIAINSYSADQIADGDQAAQTAEKYWRSSKSITDGPHRDAGRQLIKNERADAVERARLKRVPR